MTDCAIDHDGVCEAKGWANKLIAASHRGPGDTTDAAIHRAAQKHGLDPKLLWRLRYRNPKSIIHGAWTRIKAAHDAECERQEAKLRHELEITKALSSSASALAAIREAQAVLGAAEGKESSPAPERAE